MSTAAYNIVSAPTDPRFPGRRLARVLRVPRRAIRHATASASSFSVFPGTTPAWRTDAPSTPRERMPVFGKNRDGRRRGAAVRRQMRFHDRFAVSRFMTRMSRRSGPPSTKRAMYGMVLSESKHQSSATTSRWRFAPGALAFS